MLHARAGLEQDKKRTAGGSGVGGVELAEILLHGTPLGKDLSRFFFIFLSIGFVPVVSCRFISFLSFPVCMRNLPSFRNRRLGMDFVILLQGKAGRRSRGQGVSGAPAGFISTTKCTKNLCAPLIAGNKMEGVGILCF